MACWGCGLLVLIVAVVIAILAATGVILTQEASEPLEPLDSVDRPASRQFNEVQASGSQEYMKDPPASPPPDVSSPPPWHTTRPFDEAFYSTVPEAFEGILKLEDLDWQEELADAKSRVYRQVSSEIEKHIKDLLEPSPNSAIVKIHEIKRDGEIKFRVSYPPQTSVEETQSSVETSIRRNGNSIGPYRLSRFQIGRLNDRCRQGNFGCEENCRYDYLETDFVCFCTPEKTLDENGKNCLNESDSNGAKAGESSAEPSTELNREFVQGRSRGPGPLFEPRQPTDWDYSERITEIPSYKIEPESSAEPTTEPPIDRLNDLSGTTEHLRNSEDAFQVQDHDSTSARPHFTPSVAESKSEIESSTEAKGTTESEPPLDPTAEPRSPGEPKSELEHFAEVIPETEIPEIESSTESKPFIKPQSSVEPEPAPEHVTEAESSAEREHFIEPEVSTESASPSDATGEPKSDFEVSTVPTSTQDTSVSEIFMETTTEPHGVPDRVTAESVSTEISSKSEMTTFSENDSSLETTVKADQFTDTSFEDEITTEAEISTRIDMHEGSRTNTTDAATKSALEEATEQNSPTKQLSDEADIDPALKVDSEKETHAFDTFEHTATATPTPDTKTELNETNVIDRLPATGYSSLPKNFAQNVEPLLEPITNYTQDEHIMTISKTKQPDRVHESHEVIPQLIPEQFVPSSTEEPLKSERDNTSAVLHPDENIVSAPDSNYSIHDSNQERSTSHPLHPASYPETVLDREKSDDRFTDDMSPFLPDVQREKEASKKAPRLDKDEQNVPNPFDGHVEDVIADQPKETMPIVDGNETEMDSLSDKYPNIDASNENPEILEDRIKSDNIEAHGTADDAKASDSAGLAEPSEGEADAKKKSGEENPPIEDEEALKVVPLQEPGESTTLKHFLEDGDREKVHEQRSEISTTESIQASTTMLAERINEESDETLLELSSEKPEENALEDQYNDITDDAISKGYQRDYITEKDHRRDEQASQKPIPSTANGEEYSEGPKKEKEKEVNDNATTSHLTDKPTEDAKLTTEIPVLPMEIQQEVETTVETTDVTAITETNEQLVNVTEKSSATQDDSEKDTTVPPVSATQMTVVEKTTAQIPILPEELQTTESDVVSSTSSTMPLLQNLTARSNNEENKSDVESTSVAAPDATTIDELLESNDETTEKTTSTTTESVMTEGSKVESTIPMFEEHATTTEVAPPKAPDSTIAMEDVRPVTEVIMDDTVPSEFDFRSFFTTTTKEPTLPADTEELSEEDLRVIPLEKSQESKKKLTDKKSFDKFKYKKEKELNLEEDGAPTELPEITVSPEERESFVDEEVSDNVFGSVSSDAPSFTLADKDGNIVPISKLQTIDVPNSNRSEPGASVIARHDSTEGKKYPSFIPVSEEIDEPIPVTQPFIILPNFTTRPTIESELRSAIDTADTPRETISVHGNSTENETGFRSVDSKDSSRETSSEEVEVDQVAKSPDVTGTGTGTGTALHPPPNVVFSKCTTGQFQCVNGTSRDGAYCVGLSAKCDSENDCSDGSDEFNCEEEGCPGNFQCTSGQCLRRHLVCNGIVDCDDGSDEADCKDWKCQFDEFRCPSGRCIPGLWQCDGRPDCEDHRDEYSCTESCGNNEYLCPTEKWCIPQTWHCNGVPECVYGEDEKLCDCALDQFKCDTGGCVPKEQVCDGIEHCPDQSDEWDCLLVANVTDEGNVTQAEREGELDSDDSNELVNRVSLLRIRQASGEYRVVCSDGWTQEFSDSYCRALGYSAAETTESSPWDKQYRILRLKANGNVRGALIANLEQTEFCTSDRVIEISCQRFSCGSHNAEGPTARLVGGTTAGEGQWPSVALLKEPKHGIACTASVLGPMHALASYSCVHKYRQSSGWQLFTGGNRANTHAVKNIVPYPQVKYNQFLYNNDIALIVLERPLHFSRNVSAVCLPSRPIQPRQLCVTAGWGFPMDGEVDLQQYRKFLPVPTIDSETCNATSHYAGFITKYNICAGFTDTEKGPCYNDEGAPLMCVSDSERWEIQGLLSHHSRCSRGHPAIYSSLEPALSWLRHLVPALQLRS